MSLRPTYSDENIANLRKQSEPRPKGSGLHSNRSGPFFRGAVSESYALARLHFHVAHPSPTVCQSGSMTQRETAQKMGVSDRWVRVLLKRMSKHDDAGVGAWTEWVPVESQPCGGDAAASAGNPQAAGMVRFWADVCRRTVGKPAHSRFCVIRPSGMAWHKLTSRS